jgi:hypothetical protein
MLRDYFTPEEPDDCRPIPLQNAELQLAMADCAEVLPYLPSERRKKLVMAIGSMASTSVLLDKIHEAYMHEYELTHGPIEHKE